jgi:three-Cys-motif partner protein
MAKNRNQTQFEDYRDWQWIKHLILRNYAEAWSVIVGKQSKSIFVVDACAGAGSYLDPDTGATISEGSPVIFANRAKTYTEERGPGKTMRVICCEKDRHNHDALATNLLPYEPHYTLMPQGGFERHVPEIAETLGNSPAMILLDPIGMATIPADAWRPLLLRKGKTDIFIVLNFTGVHRTRGWMLSDGTPNPEIEGARAGIEKHDRVFNGQEWRAIALDPKLAGEEHRDERERRYVQLYFDQVIGDRHHWKGSIAVRAQYSSPVKYWLIHASDDEKPYELMNNQVVRVNEQLLDRENAGEGQLQGFAKADLEAHQRTTSIELEQAIRECVASSPGGQIPFGALRKKLAGRFFGRVRWVGGYGAAIRNLCAVDRLRRQAPQLRAKFEDAEIIQAVEPEPAPPGGEVVPIRRVA